MKKTNDTRKKYKRFGVGREAEGVTKSSKGSDIKIDTLQKEIDKKVDEKVDNLQKEVNDKVDNLQKEMNNKLDAILKHLIPPAKEEKKEEA